MTLRARVLLGLGVIAVVFGVTAVVVPRLTESYLVDQVDDQLAESGVPLFDGFGPGDGSSHDDPLGTADAGGGCPTEDPFDGPGPDDEGDGDPPERPSRVFAAVISADGQVCSTVDPNVGAVSAPEVTDALIDEALDRADEAPFTVETSEGTRLRMLARSVEDQDGAVALVGLPLDDVDAAIGRLVRIEAGALLAVLVALVLVAWWVIRLGVRPVNEMAAAATEIGAGDLSARVPARDPGTEAGRLGAALNQMLGRIEDEFDQRLRSEQRLRQFAADASHELRTPVTTVRGYAELYRSGALDDPAELAEAMRRVEQETVRMGGLVEDLLRLARLDQGRELDRAPVDLAGVVADAARDARAGDPDRPVNVDVDGPVVVLGDDRLLRQAVANLTANALVHTEPAVAVALRARLHEGKAIVEVSDDGPGMPAEVASRIFERFYRADSSRSRHTGGSGLGLAIVQAAVVAHGGEVSVDTAPGQGTTFRIALPAV